MDQPNAQDQKRAMALATATPFAPGFCILMLGGFYVTTWTTSSYRKHSSVGLKDLGSTFLEQFLHPTAG
jgi:hypothetical protein